jgi:hypothetical protein
MKKFYDDTNTKIYASLEKVIKNPPVMDVSIPLKVLNTLSLVNGLLKVLPQGVKLSENDYEKVVTFAFVWSVGGLYEAV